MSSFASHLQSLLAPSASDGGTATRDAIQAWTSLGDLSSARGGTFLTPEDNIDSEEPWGTVLDAYCVQDLAPVVASPAGQVVEKISAMSNLQPLLGTIQSLLTSTKPDELLSEELAELVGFEDLELVMEMIQHRHAVAEQLLLGPKPQTESLHNTERYLDGRLGGQLHGDPADPFAAARKRMEETLRANAARPLFSGVAEQAPEILPHVYSSTATQTGYLSQYGTKYSLNVNHQRTEHEGYDEVVLPPAVPVPPKQTERLVPVVELDPLAKGSFSGYTSLNRIQSIVYPTAYGSNENMLVCAPTGAGKTDVAMLTVLRVLGQHRNTTASSVSASIDRNAFKIIYVAPMKALASEITRKMDKRLKWLSIKVRELTGDMQLTKAEIAETQIIVTTPEKWDVVTRKPTGEGEVAAKVKLLIIDEIHLLNDERGAVIETIVARTLRQVESSQSVIRIVGLSATLPNYRDVAEFLSVSPYTGLFYFDSSFRPVPLEQHFIGIRGKPGSALSKKNLDRVVFDKVTEIVKRGHQVMVFVHARKETVKSALALKESASLDGMLEDFSCEEHPQWAMFRRSIGESRNKEMKQLFDSGFGIHHAGMLRSDRNMMERMFEARAIKVLCCTATLAWGVNLPAHAVVIKGTQVYDSARGAWVDLSVLDVLQVFGRAGRPGLETEGEGYICTTEDKLDHYLQAVTSQNPIESKFTAGMIDAMNAEVSLGTVANVRDAVQWLGYTYMFVRMKRNPFVYGLKREEPAEDPGLVAKRTELATLAGKKLADARMISFDQKTGAFSITDLGRIAARYYIRHASIEVFNKHFRPRLTEADVLAVLSMSTEFDQVQLRDAEVAELELLMKDAPCDVKGGTDTSQGKVNILLQAWISGSFIEDFALVSDSHYVAQNGGRIIRALLEVAISRKWSNASSVLMSLSKAIEKRMWPFDHPLKQFKSLKADVIYGLDNWAEDWQILDLANTSAKELGDLIHLNESHGNALLRAARQFPALDISYSLRPLGSDVLKLVVRVQSAFTWNSDVHKSVEPFWLWIEDPEESSILQLANVVIRQATQVVNVDFVISIPNGRPPPSLTIRYVSDRWMGAEDELVVPLDMLTMPQVSQSHTPRLDLPFLSLTALSNPPLEKSLSRRMHGFNALQTQVFWSLMRTKMHSLVCAPAGSGKSTIMEALVCDTLLNAKPGTWALVVVPQRNVAIELISDLRPPCRDVGLGVEMVVDGAAFLPVKQRLIRVITGSQLLAAFSADHLPALTGLRMVICDNLEQLHPAYELGVSLLRHSTQTQATRYVGVSSSLNDAADLAAWFGVDPMALHSFRPRDRDQPLQISTQTFTIPQSAALFKSMAKPCHAAIKDASEESAIIFIPSRGQCRSIALDLITQCALDMASSRGYLPVSMPEELLEHHLARLRDQTLADFVSNGVGFFHDAMRREDRALMLELFAEGVVRVLLVPREACWTLPARAGVVVVLGTQYVHVEPARDERQVREYGLTELVRMQSRAVRENKLGRFHLFCQVESKDTYTRFLDEGLPLESELLGSPVFSTWYSSARRSGRIADKGAAVQALSWTFLARRLVSNPTYYDSAAGVGSRDDGLSRIVDALEESKRP